MWQAAGQHWSTLEVEGISFILDGATESKLGEALCMGSPKPDPVATVCLLQLCFPCLKATRKARHQAGWVRRWLGHLGPLPEYLGLSPSCASDSSFLSDILGGSNDDAGTWGPATQVGNQLSTRVLASNWPGPATSGIWGSKPADGNVLILSFSFPPIK